MREQNKEVEHMRMNLNSGPVQFVLVKDKTIYDEGHRPFYKIIGLTKKFISGLTGIPESALSRMVPVGNTVESMREIINEQLNKYDAKAYWDKKKHEWVKIERKRLPEEVIDEKIDIFLAEGIVRGWWLG